MELSGRRPHRTRYDEPRFEAHTSTDRDTQFLVVRWIALSVFGILIIFLPLSTAIEVRVIVGVMLTAVFAPAGLLIERSGFATKDRIHVSLDCCATAICAVAMPELATTALVLAACLVVGAVQVQPTSFVIGMTLANAALYAGLMYGQGVHLWFAPPLAMVFLVPAIVSYFEMRNQAMDKIRDRYDTLVDAAEVFFWEADSATGEFTTVAGNSFALTGWTPDELISTGWETLIETQQIPSVRRDVVAAADRAHPVVMKLRHRDGSLRSFRHLLSLSDDGMVRGVSSDIEELAQAERKTRYQAEHDHLTGLANRSVLVERLEAALQADSGCTLLMLDLDRFKEVNDTLGHPVGDRLLKVLANRFVQNLGDTTLVARLGGDEFAVLTSDDDSSAAEALAKELALLTEAPVSIDGVSLVISPSIGIALGPEDGDTASSLLRRADIAMYQAKRNHEAFRRYVTTPGEASIARLTLGAEIGTAIDAGQFELWYQPKVDLTSGRIVGAEGLARWRHPQRGLLAPAAFLELIDLAGEYHRFTEGVLSHGIETARLCDDIGRPVEIAVNLAASSFFNEDLPSQVEAMLNSSGIPAERLMLEITESEILEHRSNETSVFGRLSALGVGLSIDDFGTGYSSLSRLRNLPVTEIKVDRSFLTPEAGPDDRIIARTVIEMARLLGHKTVAEGVEDQATANRLRSYGCDAAQGYLWAKPMPRDEFLEMLGAPNLMAAAQAS